MKTYILYYKWRNTANNHAGMAYLAEKIKQTYGKDTVLIKHPYRILGHTYWGRRFYRIYATIWAWNISLFLKIRLKSEDKVFFMEYGSKVGGDQQCVAGIMRKFNIKNKFYGLVHIPEENLLRTFKSENNIRNILNLLDTVLVFGSSLEKYLNSINLQGMVKRTYHYVDTDFYKPLLENKNEDFRIICMGNQLRNNNLLHEVVKACPNVNFDICAGLQDLTSLFSDCKNAKLYGFISEKELLLLMQKSAVSLNVMNDTEGSNVITTSMACGLAMIVSDVGSIRDYCDDKNAFFCENNNLDSFLKAIDETSKNASLTQSMQKESLNKVEKISLKNFTEIELLKLLEL